MANDLKCPICGEPTRVYMGNARKDRLCGKHADMLKAGEITKCPDCGEWYMTNETCKCKLQEKYTELPTEGFDKCVICGTPTKGYAFCRKCWKEHSEEEMLDILNGVHNDPIVDQDPPMPTESPKVISEPTYCIICGAPSNGSKQCANCEETTEDFMDTLDKNSTPHELRDYYHNLKDRIGIIKGMNEVKSQCNKLIAIAKIEFQINDDSALIDRVYRDVEDIIKRKSQLKEQTNKFIIEKQRETDEKNRRINTAQDGHTVDSDMEAQIDDILYTNYILHCYGKNIGEIGEQRRKCDWFIPICNGEGIYIEYWGMDTPDYLKSRKEKEELYQKNNIPYISIEKDDPKKDKQSFKDNLLRELTAKAIERYGFMPKWKR